MNLIRRSHTHHVCKRQSGHHVAGDELYQQVERGLRMRTKSVICLRANRCTRTESPVKAKMMPLGKKYTIPSTMATSKAHGGIDVSQA